MTAHAIRSAGETPRSDEDRCSPMLIALRGKIGWLCHAVRIGAVAYAVWVLALIVSYWSDTAAIANGYGRMLHADLSGMQHWQPATAFAIDFAIWIMAAAACYSVWRLFTSYLQGEIFAAPAARWMERVALWGLAAQILGVLSRPLISLVLTSHLASGQSPPVMRFFLKPDDLLTLGLLASLLALAYIQRTAAEIADEHRQIV